MILLARISAHRALASHRLPLCLRINTLRYASQVVKSKTPREAAPRVVATPQYASKRPG